MSEMTGGDLASDGLTPALTRQPPRARRRSLRGFYLGLTALMVAIVGAGFWPSYYGRVVDGTLQAHWLIHLHGLVFSGWMVLLAVQVVLAARRRVDLHRRLGNFGIGYGALVFVMGLVVTAVAPVLRVTSGAWSRDEAAAFLILPLGDMVLFGGLFAAAVWYRRKPETHKRLIVLATIALLFAAAGRLAGESLPAFFAIWMVPLVVALAHDLASRGRVHRVYAVGTVLLLVAFMRVLAMESAWWLRIGRGILEVLLPSS